MLRSWECGLREAAYREYRTIFFICLFDSNFGQRYEKDAEKSVIHGFFCIFAA